MKTNLKHIILTTSLMAFSACTPYMESFDCPPGQGVGCQSLSTVNQMVEEGELPFGKSPLEDYSPEQEQKTSSSSQESQLIEARAPLRADEITSHPTSHVKVWLAGYEESHGNDRFYHAPSLVYVAK